MKGKGCKGRDRGRTRGGARDKGQGIRDKAVTRL